VFNICHSSVACAIYFKALVTVIGFQAASKSAHVVAGSDCCSESSWQHCDRDR